MQAQRSIMKNRGLRSGNRLPRRNAFLAAAMIIIFTVMAAAAFCKFHSATAAGREGTDSVFGNEDDETTKSPYEDNEARDKTFPPDRWKTSSPKEPGIRKQEGEKPDAGEPERGLLILEDPHEKTRYAEYEAAVGDSFSITFIHSVNKSPVTDFFVIREDGIYGVKTVYYGFGAGVPTELEEGQTLSYGEDGSMIISGSEVKMNSLIYRVGTVSDHILTLEDGNGISLRELCGRSARVGFRFETDKETEEKK